MPPETPDALAEDSRAARAALGLGAQAGPAEVEAAFRGKVRPLAVAAAHDPQASEALRRLIEARALLRRAFAEAARARAPVQAEVSPGRASRPEAASASAAPPLVARAFRLMRNGRDVAVEISLDALVAAAAGGALAVTLVAPVLRRCPLCAGAGRSACARCGGAGVEATGRTRFVPLDLARLADDDFAILASPWADAMGRGALGGPLLRAVLV